jgi:DNA-binding protein Alba
VLFGFDIQEKGSSEIVLKAMGRAINKTVTIAEIIKVLLS